MTEVPVRAGTGTRAAGLSNTPCLLLPITSFHIAEKVTPSQYLVRKCDRQSYMVHMRPRLSHYP